MSNLLKSKSLLGVTTVAVMFAAVMFAGVLALTANAQTTNVYASAFTYSGVMKQGMSGPGISTLQAALNSVQSGTIVVDGAFGPATRGAVVQFQMSKGLTADGVVGPMTGAALAQATLAVITIPIPGLPAGCTSTSGFSPVTGAACNSGVSGLPAGCSSTSGFSSSTGLSCSGGSSPSTPSGPLTGGAGSITVDDSNAFTSEEAEEGEEDVEVLAFTVEADEDSDVEVTSIRVEFENEDVTGTPSSDDFDDYAESVSVWFDGEMVGEADISDFSESGDIWTKSISLDGVVVRAGEEEEITVAVTAISNIDTDDTDSDDWEADVTSVRFEDAEGVVTTTDEGMDAGELEQEFDFVPAGDGEDLELKSSTNDPDASSLLVDGDDESEEFEVFAFNLEGEDSDIDLTELTLEVLTTGANYDVVVSDVRIEIDGEEADDFNVTGGASTTGTLVFDLDGDYTVGADDTVEVVVFMSFQNADIDGDGVADGAYDDAGAETVQVRTVSVEGEGADDITDTATVTGNVHTLSYSVANITNMNWTSSASDGTGVIDFFFTVSADDEDFDVLGAEILDTATAAFDNAAEPNTFSGEGLLSRVSGDTVDTIAGPTGYQVDEGETTTFRVRYTATAAGSYEATITSVAGQAVDEDDQVSPTVNLDS